MVEQEPRWPRRDRLRSSLTTPFSSLLLKPGPINAVLAAIFGWFAGSQRPMPAIGTIIVWLLFLIWAPASLLAKSAWDKFKWRRAPMQEERRSRVACVTADDAAYRGMRRLGEVQAARIKIDVYQQEIARNEAAIERARGVKQRLDDAIRIDPSTLSRARGPQSVLQEILPPVSILDEPIAHGDDSIAVFGEPDLDDFTAAGEVPGGELPQYRRAEYRRTISQAEQNIPLLQSAVGRRKEEIAELQAFVDRYRSV